METQFNEDKFKELIVYIALRSETDQRFGAVKLNKLLFYSDFAAFRVLGNPITGATYQNLNEGPAPREFLNVQKAMLHKDVELERRPYFGGTFQKRLVAKRPPDMSDFTVEEIRIIEGVIAEFWNMNARQISQYSHEEYGWRLTDEGETIPYAASYFDPGPLTQEQIERGQEVASKHELQA